MGDTELEDFSHHPLTLEQSIINRNRWKEACADTGIQGRCPVCWLRRHDCYCSTLDTRRDTYASGIRRCELILYYSYRELGRSPNTAHVLETLLPYCTRTIVLGEVNKEREMIQEIIEEYQANKRRTAILWPNKHAMLLSEWKAVIDQQRDADKGDDDTKEDTSSTNSTNTNKNDDTFKYRLIALEGTYKDATKLYKTLVNAINRLDPSVPLPIAKLDLGEEGCASAMIGIMVQPNKEKVCTYQACVMAIQQLGESTPFCDALHKELSDWTNHLITKRVKIPKTRIKVPANAVNKELFTPMDCVAREIARRKEQGQPFYLPSNPTSGSTTDLEGLEELSLGKEERDEMEKSPFV